MSIAPADISWLKASPTKNLTNLGWMLSLSRTTSSRRCHLMARHGRTEAQKEHFIAHNARRRCPKQKFEGIHDRFLKDSTYRDLQLKIGWTEETCIAMDKLAQEDHSYCPLPEEFDRYRKNWYLTLNKSGRNAPMKLRSDFREALTNMHRLHRESGEERPEPIHIYQYQKWHSSSSSSSTSWWQWNEYWRSS